MISTITSTQVYKQIAPIVRKNMTHLFIYRLRNYGDLKSIVEELSAVYDQRTRLQIYHEAVDEPYAFLYVSLIQKDKRKMFMTKFSHYLNPSYILFSLFYYVYWQLLLTVRVTYSITLTTFIETILLQLNPSSNYYTTGDDDVMFIKIGFNKVLLLDYTYNINRTVFSKL